MRVIYQKNINEFQKDIYTNIIDKKISEGFELHGMRAPKREVASWKNSLQYISNAFNFVNIDKSTFISIEMFVLNNRKQRIDVCLFGYNNTDRKSMVIIELKQWQEAEDIYEEISTDQYVKTFLGGKLTKTRHPSAQASSYKETINNFNEYVRSDSVDVSACSYLHNMDDKLSIENLNKPIYFDAISEAPLFHRGDSQEISNWINEKVGMGEGMEIAYGVSNSNYSPGKSVSKMYEDILNNVSNFSLTEEQSNIAEDILSNNIKSNLVYGGPGTGKTILAAHLLKKGLDKGKNVVIATPNSQLRNAIVNSLSKENRSKTLLNSLILGAGSFGNINQKYDIVILDEAQGMNGLPMQGVSPEQMFRNIYNSTKKLVLLYDDNQKLRVKEIGGKKELKKHIKKFNNNSKMKEYKITTNLRSVASNNFIELIEYLFDKRKDFVKKLNSFEFNIYDDPNNLYDNVIAKNRDGISARVLATFSWKWISQKSPNSGPEDIVIPKYNFKKYWNDKNVDTWALNDNTVNEIGSIHTTRGQEFDHVGVIIGKHIKYVDGEITIDWNHWHGTAKYGAKDDKQLQLEIVYNSIYTLMTRARKSCSIFIEDESLRKYIKEKWS